jgi:hypothetical protein
MPPSCYLAGRPSSGLVLSNFGTAGRERRRRIGSHPLPGPKFRATRSVMLRPSLTRRRLGGLSANTWFPLIPKFSTTTRPKVRESYPETTVGMVRCADTVLIGFSAHICTHLCFQFRCYSARSSCRLQPVDQTEDCLAGVIGARHPQGFQVIRFKLESHEKGSSTLPLPHTTHSGRR